MTCYCTTNEHECEECSPAAMEVRWELEREARESETDQERDCYYDE